MERRLRDAVTSQLGSRLPFWSHFDHGHDSTARLVVDTDSTVGIPEGPTPHTHGFPTEASGTPLDVFASDVLCCTSPFVHQAFILSTPASKPLLPCTMRFVLFFLLSLAGSDYLIADKRNSRVQQCPSASPASPCITVAGTSDRGTSWLGEREGGGGRFRLCPRSLQKKKLKFSQTFSAGMMRQPYVQKQV